MDRRHSGVDPSSLTKPATCVPLSPTSAPNILADALACTQGDRQAAYGSPIDNWARTAKIAQAITGLDCLTPEVCVKVAIAMKQARLIQTPGHRDSMVDLAGYAWVLSEVVA